MIHVFRADDKNNLKLRESIVMLYFNMSPDPDDRSVKPFGDPLCPRVLVIGDFFIRPDNRPIDDRTPQPIHPNEMEALGRREKLTGPHWQSLGYFVQNAPAKAHIDWMNASMADLIDDFDGAPTLSKSGLFRMINMYNHQGMRPYSLVVVLDAVSGDLQRRLGMTGRIKNMPVLVERAELGPTADGESKFVVPCPVGAIPTALEVLRHLTGKTAAPDVTTCAGSTLSSLLVLTHLAQQVLHIDYHRGTPSRDQDATAMTTVLNGGLAARLRHLPEVSARISEFVWKQRPTAEAMLSVTTPEMSFADRVVLQFEFG